MHGHKTSHLPIRYFLALLWAHPILHISTIRVKHSCMYAKRGGGAAYHIVWIGLCLRSVPGVRVLASAVDDES